MLDSTRRLLEEWGADLVADVLAALASGNNVASGTLYNSLRHEVRESIDELAVAVVEEDYGKFLDKGRRPGKQPPLDRIREWCRLRGIPERAAYPIARKIGRFGTRPTNYFSGPLSVRLALLDQELPVALRDDILAMVVELAASSNE